MEVSHKTHCTKRRYEHFYMLCPNTAHYLIFKNMQTQPRLDFTAVVTKHEIQHDNTRQ